MKFHMTSSKMWVCYTAQCHPFHLIHYSTIHRDTIRLNTIKVRADNNFEDILRCFILRFILLNFSFYFVCIRWFTIIFMKFIEQYRSISLFAALLIILPLKWLVNAHMDFQRIYGPLDVCSTAWSQVRNVIKHSRV